MAHTTNRGTAIVTGASSGIGEVYAERLADRGYDIVLVARRRDKLEAQAARLAARTGRKVEALPADLSVAEGRAIVERRLGEDKSITLLINNAGAVSGGPLAAANPDALETMLAINIIAVTRLSAVAAKAFVERKAGTIVNIASAMAFIITPSANAYAASKAYVLNFTRGLHEEVAQHGVRVQAVLPGYTRTPFLSEELLASIPAEMVMPVDELVDAALSGLDQGEVVTIASLPDAADWEALDAARVKVTQGASRDHPAKRYTVASAAAA